MSNVIVCPRCRHGNELGRIFCTQCGTKLDLAQMARGGGRRPFAPLTWLAGAVRLGVLLGLLALLALLLWPAAPAGACGPAAEATALLGQREQLAQALQHGRALQQEIAEGALNAYLAATLQLARSNEEAAAVWMMNLTGLNVALRPGLVTVTALAHWGPVALTWEVSGTPQIADKRFGLAVRSGRLGHLDLPHAGAEWLAARLAALFQRWAADRELLDRLAAVTAEQGRATLGTPAAAATP